MPIRFYFDKLVRDNIVQACLDDPEVLHMEFIELGDTDYLQALIKKVNEEAAEIIPESTREERLSEIADLQNVVDALREREGASEQELRQIANLKTEKKGGFKKRHYISYVDLADDSKWVEIFRNQPDKYREEAL